MLWKLAYNVFVLPILFFLFRFAGLFNKKIKTGIEGRTDLFNSLEQKISTLTSKQRLLFHASSLGEFEQAKPIIAALKERFPKKIDIIVSFFSPSGYENSKAYKLADAICYIPFDTPWNASRFVNIVQPNAVIILRYDVWPNSIWSFKKRKIPLFIVNATMKKNSLRFFPIIQQFHKYLYDSFNYILTVSTDDVHAFQQFGITKPVLASIGDTRFDQVLKRSVDAYQRQIFSRSVIKGKKIFVVGQSWGEDDDVLLPVLFKLLKLHSSLLTIIVPHEPTVEHLEELENKLERRCSFIRFSEMNKYNGEQVILIDSIGILVALYQYAHVAYVGGSFRQGVHNVLEPAVFGIPVLYGPKHLNSQEAIELANRGGAFVVQNEKELYRRLRSLLENDDQRKRAGVIAKSFVEENCGATERFLQYFEPYIKP